jgi:hypothetical protein
MDDLNVMTTEIGWERRAESEQVLVLRDVTIAILLIGLLVDCCES